MLACLLSPVTTFKFLFLGTLDVVWLASARCVVTIVITTYTRKCSWPPVPGQVGVQVELGCSGLWVTSFACGHSSPSPE